MGFLHGIQAAEKQTGFAEIYLLFLRIGDVSEDPDAVSYKCGRENTEKVFPEAFPEMAEMHRGTEG